LIHQKTWTGFMNSVPETEGNWLVSLDEQSKALFLAILIHAITIAGRSSYRPHTEELDKPAQLRKTNEIQHRLSACLLQMLRGLGSGKAGH
jgi:hypothetical protein